MNKKQPFLLLIFTIFPLLLRKRIDIHTCVNGIGNMVSPDGKNIITTTASVKTSEKSNHEDISVESVVILDRDAQKLTELGYKQEFTREISLFVQAGFAFSTMAVLPNWLVGFSGTMNAGGPMSLFWGIIVISPFVLCIALGMAELFSAYPVNGGVYSWCYLLSGPEWGPLMAWVCGYVFVGGLLAVVMTVAYTMAQYVVAISNVMNVRQIDSQGALVGLYILFLILGVGYSYMGIKFSGYLNKFMVYWVVIGTILIVIVMPVMAPTHPSASWVFTEFTNNTGYQNVGITFFLGLLQAGWSLIGYENGAQIAEGTKNAERTGARGILIAVVGAIVQALVICIATMFSIQDLDELQSSSSAVATLFLRATNKSLTAFFLVILVVAQFGSLANSLLAVAQLMWSMARDGCIPNRKFWYKLSGRHEAPLRILLLVATICIVVILPSLASQVYWSAIMSTAVICVNVAYGLPFVCRLIFMRGEFSRGPFHLGRWSFLVNVIAVSWIAFFGVILCFPNVSPVDAETMNWASVMIGAVLTFSLTFWFLGGRKNYKGPMQTLGESH
ncbi:amino acid permease-domain-containing protein [Dichotomocladium elegans]|nr:amino acid permease-domain-containing protein [Dichotomocladium elegans]